VLSLIAIKTNRKFLMSAVFAVVIVGVLALAPQKWFDRTDTIVNYKGESSAESRLMAWGVAFRYALDHPFLGGGFFATARDEVYLKYIMEKHAHVPHSIWFSLLSEHGFPGATLFAALVISTFLTLRSVRRPRHGRRPPQWVVDYSQMLEISIAGYAVAGSFLNAAYMDIFYWLVAMTVLLAVIAEREGEEAPAPTPAAPTPAGLPRVNALRRHVFPGGPHVRDRWVR
jgi:probable O-glycosylation ligase (exosortase A-associated)